jgi:hypothetical protein
MGRILLTVEVIPHSEQRYATAGDWQVDSTGTLRVRVSDTGYRSDAFLVGLHEAVEAFLCLTHGVKEADVDAFDVEFGETHDLLVEEPGADPAAPYFREHATADVVERLVALQAGVPWQAYDERVNALFAEKER